MPHDRMLKLKMIKIFDFLSHMSDYIAQWNTVLPGSILGNILSPLTNQEREAIKQVTSYDT
ncbi:MAG: hypothetical protein A6F71_08260 [Cycloclasticus sp. symbiont of Poecilosclerida sp. M]|nr:MAG: hypothetical protein A6F71_08260 [Cycloclasticus sp. symbiont of Poecilosclerida sp. M]